MAHRSIATNTKKTKRTILIILMEMPHESTRYPNLALSSNIGADTPEVTLGRKRRLLLF